MNRYADADRDLQRALQLRPDNVTAYLQRAWIQMLWKGDTAEVHRVLAEAERHLSRLQIVRGLLVKFRFCFAMLGPAWQDEVARQSVEVLGVPAGSYHLAKMELFQRRRDLRLARAHADSAVLEFEPRARTNPGDEYVHGELAAAYAGQGRAVDARREAEAAVQVADRRNDATLRAFRSADVVRVYISLQDYDRAIAQLGKERRDATILSQRLLLNHPDFAALRNRGDFKALVATFP
jgi:hypothetical protein